MRPNILVCCSGSVASVKIPEIIVNLHKWANILLVPTPNGKYFLESSKYYNPDIYREYQIIQESSNILLTDSHEWMTWNQKGDPVLHIELRRWADIILVAPASANTIAKAANGICDNLVLCTIRAWDHSRPAICCPAMNSYMLDHPSLSLHLTHLKSFGFQILESDVKTLACGDVGKGALASVSEIVGACRLAVSSLPAENPERYLEKQAAQDVIKSILRADVGRSHHASFIVPTNILSKTVAVVSIFLLGYLFGMYNTRANKNK